MRGTNDVGWMVGGGGYLEEAVVVDLADGRWRGGVEVLAKGSVCCCIRVDFGSDPCHVQSRIYSHGRTFLGQHPADDHGVLAERIVDVVEDAGRCVEGEGEVAVCKQSFMCAAAAISLLFVLLLLGRSVAGHPGSAAITSATRISPFSSLSYPTSHKSVLTLRGCGTAGCGASASAV